MEMNRMSQNEINAIRSRLGSVSPTAMLKLPQAVQKLLMHDVPKLISTIQGEDFVPPCISKEFAENRRRIYIPS